MIEKTLGQIAYEAWSRVDMAEKGVTECWEAAANAVIEECAKVAEHPGFIMAQDTEWDAGVEFAKPFIAKAIRTLKKSTISPT